MHSACYVYNDLNLDNLLLDYHVDNDYVSDDIFDRMGVNLIDMSFVTPYYDKHKKEHVRKTTLDVYRGSVFFSSLN